MDDLCFMCNFQVARNNLSAPYFCSICLRLCHLFCWFRQGETEECRLMCSDCVNIFPFNHLESEGEFVRSIQSGDDTCSIGFSFDSTDKVFCPFDVDDKLSHYLHDLDPDEQLLSTYLQRYGSPYFNEYSFNVAYESPQFEFTVMSLNIRSALYKLNTLNAYLQGLKTEFSVIGLTETWFSHSTVDAAHLPNYSHVSSCRHDRNGGGVSLFIRNGLQYLVPSELSVMSESFESLFIEFPKGSLCNYPKSLYVGVIYRPPRHNHDEFFEQLLVTLHKIKASNAACLLLGDFNYDLLNSDCDAHVESFLEILYSNTFIPLINRPTRVCDQSATLIDNIFFNDFMKVCCEQGVLVTDISDHFPIFCRFQSFYKNCPRVVRKRHALGERNISRFKEYLNDVDWSEIINCNDCQLAYTRFHNLIIAAYNDFFPVVECRSRYLNRLPWLSYELRRTIVNKNKLYRQFKRCPTLFNKRAYIECKQNLRREMRVAERDHYHELFERYIKDSKKTWSVIREVIKGESLHSLPEEFEVDGSIVRDKNLIAEAFNDFFITIGPKVDQSIPASDVDPASYVRGGLLHSFFLMPVTRIELENTIRDLKNKCPGWDGIVAEPIKAAFSPLAMPLLHVINLSFLKGVFPNELKVAQVVPLFKKGSPKQISNYRPISLLPLFSKVFEKLVHKRLFQFATSNNLLSPDQFGFQPGKNTTQALISVADKITRSFERGEAVVGVLLDFQKAFDTVQHTILLRKLEKYGVRGIPLLWFQSYLFDRRQRVAVNDIFSSFGSVTCGVPQGSILGPLLFLLYVNDITTVSERLHYTLFADDTNVFLSGRDVSATISALNVELNNLEVWLRSNRLLLNLTKTKYIIFSPRHINNQSQVSINNHVIDRVEYAAFLGVILDENLRWDKHISHVRSKVSRAIGVFSKINKYFPERTLKMIYFAIVYPHFTYGIEVWGSASNVHLLPLIRLQKKIIRLMTSSYFRESSAPLFDRLGILNLKQLYIFHVIFFMFKFINNLLPPLFDDVFSLNTPGIHNTRILLPFRTPFFRLVTCRRCISYQGPYYYNLYFHLFDSSTSKTVFKNNLKLICQNL